MARVGVGDDSPRRAPPGAHKGAPLRMGTAPTRERPYGWGGRPQGSAPTDGEGAHKGAPLRGGGRPQGSAPTGGRAPTRERPYGWGGRPQGSAPTDGEGAHKGAPLRGGGRPQGSAPTGRRAPTRERPYGWGGRPQGSAPTGGRHPYGWEEGAHEGAPLRFLWGRPGGGCRLFGCVWLAGGCGFSGLPPRSPPSWHGCWVHRASFLAGRRLRWRCSSRCPKVPASRCR